MNSNPNALAALAMLKANWDQCRKSHLDSVFPFISAALSKVDEEGARVEQVQESLRIEFGLQLAKPIVENLLYRGCTRGIYQKHGDPIDRSFSIKASADEEELAHGIALWNRKAKILRQQEALLASFIKFASQEFGEVISEAEAEERLLREVERASVPVLRNWLWGEQFTDESETYCDPDYATSKFILHLYERDLRGFSDLADIVQGNMLASALYYAPRLKAPTEHFKKTYIVLDTRILFRALGYEGVAEKEVALDVLRLTDELHGQPVCFKRTIQEMSNVLAAVEKSLAGGSRPATEGGPVRRYFLSEKATPSDIKLKSANLEIDLRSIKVRVIGMPEYSGPLGVNEERLNRILRERVHYRNNDAVLHDLDVLTAVFRFRGGEVQPSLEDCKAIFITPNDRVVQACRKFFQDEDISESRWPLALEDHAFATILWLKRPQQAPDLPRKQLIANAYAGTSPSLPLWKMFLAAYEKLVAQGGDLESAYNRLRYNLDVERLLMAHTMGDVSRFNEGTIYEILEDVKNKAAQDQAGNTQVPVENSTEPDSAPLAAEGSSEEQNGKSSDSDAVRELQRVRGRLDQIARRRANVIVVLLAGLILMAICAAVWAGLPPPVGPAFHAIPGAYAIVLKMLTGFGGFAMLAGIIFGFTLSGGMKAARERLRQRLLNKLLGQCSNKAQEL